MASRDPQPLRPPTQPGRAPVRSAWAVSVLSLLWTAVSGSSAVAIGVRSGSVVLVAFGAVGFVDALGSATLAYHFRQGLRRQALSPRLERRAHRLVVAGLLLVGVGAVVGGGLRLVNEHLGESTAAGTGLAAVSLVVLSALAARKRAVAARVASAALLGDSRLSALGAAQAAVTLLGILTTGIGWEWADPVAAIVVGSVATAVALRTGAAELR